MSVLAEHSNASSAAETLPDATLLATSIHCPRPASFVSSTVDGVPSSPAVDPRELIISRQPGSAPPALSGASFPIVGACAPLEVLSLSSRPGPVSRQLAASEGASCSFAAPLSTAKDAA